MSNNGFIQMEVGGQKVGLKFGLTAITQIGKMEPLVPFYNEIPATETEEAKTVYSELGISHIMYAGYCNNCYIKYEQPVFKFEDFYNVVEDCILNKDKVAAIINPVLECYQGSKYVEAIAEPAGDQSKKKSEPGMKLNLSVMEHSG